MATVKVKWGKELLELTVSLQSTVGAFKEKLQQLTQVPVERQKIMGLKANASKDDATLSQVGVTDGKTLMLLGAAAEPPQTKEPPPSPAAASNTTAVQAPAAATRMPTGLRNIANTCYMNAAVQMLRLVPELIELLQSRKNDTLLHSMGELYKTMEANKDPVTPLLFWNALIMQNSTFGEVDEHGHPMQHDAQEVLNTILQQLNNGIQETHRNLFSGTMKRTSVCKEIPDDVSEASDLPFLMLSCNINAEVQMLETGLYASFNETIPVRSEKLAREVLYSRTSRISILPEYLFVHLVRFSWRADTQKKAKILKPVSFPLVLDTFTLCTDALKESMQEERGRVLARRDKELERRRQARQKTQFDVTANEEEVSTGAMAGDAHNIGNKSGYYELCGVISHKGRSAESGHYVFWGRPEDQWFVYDDEHVASVTEEDVKRLSGVGEAHIAYVLMYRSRDPRTKATTIPL
ncbi:ubiquitin hydrolase [Trypanosoma cruzi Dm28c]|uniref:Ubiquitin carboxyl-terminal hydrolase n=2 Tax=Trypanosoma cruzi TaxID=5693 RepID=V5BIL0_TRYCR|nr:ubiquitin hydrolase [Trypanosoma cruzi Dm28c]PBJ68464.1 ubiquitin hydrolase CA [Trypanosoma cruzi cruzi]PWU83842.1 putative ubiquitin carboxyl-terminal hydrolase [Trypanosoma cruzi]PWU91216.1 putative ubiquitin carboxyl-terminal hydrolase [Trypanosoma cruzi]